MSASTTLMTFLVRTPPNTRSVKLLGSWDNFSKPYAMQRDMRVGPEHWTGCHSFQNIICDGNLSSTGSARDGGLKMGGTYWYYYHLDDIIDFHNSAEPSTTSCPLLPGQLVNVLQVPFHLSSGRPRNDSVSSTSSQLRTMNPEDKFLNPRPVPTLPPKLARLNTSPTLPQHPTSLDSSPWTGSSWSTRSASSGQGGSQPNSAAAPRMFRLPRKMSTDGKSRSTSPGTKTNGLRATFRQLTSPRATSPEGDVTRGRVGQHGREFEIGERVVLSRNHSGRINKPSSLHSSRCGSPQSVADHHVSPIQLSQFALRRRLDQPLDIQEGVAVSSFQTHRRQRSRSREPSSLRNSMVLADSWTPDSSNIDTNAQPHKPLETLAEASSQQNTPTWPREGPKANASAEEILLGESAEKRLPTLPNSPSSAYAPSASSGSQAKRLSDELKVLKSHFSEMTMTSDTTSSIVLNNHSHFSEWTTTGGLSPTSDYCLEDHIPCSDPHRSRVQGPASPYEIYVLPASARNSLQREDLFTSDAEMLPSTISCSTISSCVSTSPSSPTFAKPGSPKTANIISSTSEYGTGVVSGRCQGYALPGALQNSEVALKSGESTTLFQAPRSSSTRVGVRRSDSISHSPHTQNFLHSTGMQQLIDELSYLGDMIQR